MDGHQRIGQPKRGFDGLISPFSWAFGRTRPVCCPERMTIGRLTLALVGGRSCESKG